VPGFIFIPWGKGCLNRTTVTWETNRPKLPRQEKRVPGLSRLCHAQTHELPPGSGDHFHHLPAASEEGAIVAPGGHHQCGFLGARYKPLVILRTHRIPLEKAMPPLTSIDYLFATLLMLNCQAFLGYNLESF
jgi:hypothetical protein